MFNFLKRIFGRENNAAIPAVAGAPTPAPSRAPVARVTEKAAAGGVEVARLSIRAILEKLPPDLRAIVNQMPDPEVRLVLPVNTILKQLPTGAVKMSLASLLRQAPQGTFRKTAVEEKQMVDVPLGEVFKCVDPARLGRRSDQRRYDVPDDATGLFGRNGNARSTTAAAAASEVPQEETDQPSAAAAAPRIEPVKVVKMPGIAPAAPSPANGNGHAAPAMAESQKPKAPASAALTGELVISFVELAAGWPEGIRSELSAIAGGTKLVIPAPAVSAGLQKGRVTFPWSQVRMWIRPALSRPVSIAEDFELIFPLRIMAPAFVAATGATKRREAAEIDHSLPDFFGPASTTGFKLEKPAPAVPPPAEPALPPTPAAAEPEPPSPEPVRDASAFKLVREESAPVVDILPVVEDAAIAAPVEPAAPVALAAPAAPSAPAVGIACSPAEVVVNACALPGVAGALVAIGEGLVVAQKLPPGFSADTFAAFMPQILGRLEKYTAEMQLGAVTAITIETAHGPCHIARLGKIYFGAIGRPGERLPDSLDNLKKQLAAHSS